MIWATYLARVFLLTVSMITFLVYWLQSSDTLLGNLDEEHQIVVLQKKVERHALFSRIHNITNNDNRWKTSARSPTLKSDYVP